MLLQESGHGIHRLARVLKLLPLPQAFGVGSGTLKAPGLWRTFEVLPGQDRSLWP